MQTEAITDTTSGIARDNAAPTSTGDKKQRPRKVPRFFWAILFFWLFAAIVPNEAYELVRMGGQECSKPDLITGFVHLENKKIVWKQEGFSSGKTNSSGFLDSEHPAAKAPGVYRIAMLGDSQTEALQVSQSERFSERLGERLNALAKMHAFAPGTPQKFEVLNFGISAAGTGQEYLTYLRYVERFKPDVTVLFYDSGDEDKNLRKPAMSQWYPHVVFGLDNDRLTVSWRDYDSWIHSAQAMPIALFEDMRRNSYFWGSLIQSFNSLKSDILFITGCTYLDRWKILPKIEDTLISTFPLSRFGPTDFKLPQQEIDAQRKAFCSQNGLEDADSTSAPVLKFDRKDYEFGKGAEYHTIHLSAEQNLMLQKQYQVRWQLALALLKNLAARCHQNGDKLIVVGFPAQLLKDGFGRTFTQITAAAARDGYEAMDFTPNFDALVYAKGVTPRYITHLTPAGHEVMADLLCQYLIGNKYLNLATSPSVAKPSQ